MKDDSPVEQMTKTMRLVMQDTDTTDTAATKTPEEVALAAVAEAVAASASSVPATIPAAVATAMPSEYLSHAAVYADEAQTKLTTTTSQILILRTQREGMVSKHKQMVLDMEAKLNSELTDLDRRIDDLEEVVGMAEGCLAARRSR